MGYLDTFTWLLGGLLAGVVLVALAGRLLKSGLTWPRGTRLLPGLVLVAAVQALFPWVFPAAVADVMPQLKQALWLAALGLALPTGVMLLRLGTLGLLSSLAAQSVVAVQAAVTVVCWTQTL